MHSVFSQMRNKNNTIWKLLLSLKLVCTKKNGRCLNSNVTCSDSILAPTERFENRDAKLGKAVCTATSEHTAQHPVCPGISPPGNCAPAAEFTFYHMPNPLPLSPTTPVLPKPPFWQTLSLQAQWTQFSSRAIKPDRWEGEEYSGKEGRNRGKQSAVFLWGRRVQEMSWVGVRPESPFTIY